MASAGSSLSNNEFTCSICLDFFREPVSTPCGHNFCQSCITNCWDSRDISQCPLCMTEFHRRPELQVNTGFREVVEHFKRMRAQGSDDSLAKADEVACDVCEGTKLKAVKSCLVCLVSLCQTHLEPHQRVSALKRHKLISPVGNLEDWMCKEHDKVVEFFCRRDQKFVCTSCMKDVHATHETVALEEECAVRKALLHRMDTEMKRKLNVKCLKVQQVKNSKVQGRGDTEKAKVDITKAFSALVASVESYKTMLAELLEEKQRAAEQQADDVIKHLYLQIAELKKRSTELEEVSKTEDPLQLLQSAPPVFLPSHTEGWPPIRHHSLQHVETVRSAVAKLEEMFRLEMDRVICDISQVDDGKETAENADSSEMEGLFDDELEKIQHKYAVDVTLDPDTAHPCLILSQDGKQVRDGGAKRNLPNNLKRFDVFHFVLGKEGFSSGRSYYEVKVTGQAGWEIGLVRDSICRKGDNVSLRPENGCWTIGIYWGRYQANTKPPVALTLEHEPQMVGVFVDYEERKVSFYDVETRAVIYSFTHCAFSLNAPYLRNFLWPYSGTPTKCIIYPFFRPGSEGSYPPLQITPVSRTAPTQ